MRLKPRTFVFLTICIVLAGVTIWALVRQPPGYYVAKVRSMGGSPSERWRIDLGYLVDRMNTVHPNLYHGVSRERFEAAVADLEKRIPDLTDDRIAVELIWLVALVSSRGQDGHTMIWPTIRAAGFHFLPIQTYLFSDGLYVLDADAPHERAIDSRVVSIGGVPVETIIEAIEPLVARDNDMTVRIRAPLFTICTEILNGLGLIEAGTKLEATFEDRAGGRFTLDLQGVTAAPLLERFPRLLLLPQKPDPLFLSNPTESFWFTALDEAGTVYLQYNSVRSRTESGETLADFSERLATFIDQHDVTRLVIDLRQNGGGDNTTYGPLLDMLKENSKINRRGHLFAIIGRVTFSAAANFVADLERGTKVLFVGEPTGGSPNQFGDATRVLLPNSQVSAYVSTLYWQKSDPDDPRLWFEPDLPTTYSSTDYFEDRDPALEAILAYKDAD